MQWLRLDGITDSVSPDKTTDHYNNWPRRSSVQIIRVNVK